MRQHQNKMLVGREPAGRRVFGNSYWMADALAGYHFRNVPCVTRIQPDPNVRRYIVQNPRTWRLTAEFEF